ncbi:DUF2975 domain-containing protein [Hymenobacter sp. ISL-91]|uniref:DUF2975 domain-containing protein n=1 Tax=Hymenobacter sp. ISL-91 TaxID=2819151 RepID=UPI001BE70469|nr:DUF2975 domain-containing protein [Hymenobacter sp. ISL-91]MBT2557423.1 DUF2975 domain-containing protein [Hymenobacter sp. ISL-91]
MKLKSTFVLQLMHGVFWVVFIGFCIQAGTLLIAFFVSLFIKPTGAHDLYMGLDLSELKSFSARHYAGVVSFTAYFLALKAYMAYLVLQIFRKMDFATPFSLAVASLITKISQVALQAGVLALIANAYCKWLTKTGVAVPVAWSGGELLFLAGIIFIIAQVFQRGVDIQAEHELTV